MAETELRMICPQCQGDGWYGATQGPGGHGDHPCTWKDCAGTGYISFGYFVLDPSSEDLQDKHQDIMDKLDDIKELIQGL